MSEKRLSQYRKMERSLSSYKTAYPSRDREDIQTIVWSKKEFRECKPGPGVNDEVRVNPDAFNTQEFAVRYINAYGSVFLWQEPGSGKTGVFALLQKYMGTRRDALLNTERIEGENRGEIDKFYYVSPETQSADFRRQVVYTFGKQEESIKKNKEDKGRKVSKRTQIKRYLKARNIYTLTYENFQTEIDSFKTNEELNRHFANAIVMIDEVHLIKLTEKLDLILNQGVPRKRTEIYTSYMRLSLVCPTCIWILSTGTPITNELNELVHQANLMPGMKKIRTDVSYGIIEKLRALYPDIPEQQWQTLDFDSKNKDLMKSIERIFRGRILYCMAPETPAIEAFGKPILEGGEKVNSYKTVLYDEALDRFVTQVDMSPFQTRTYTRKLIEAFSEKPKLFIECIFASVFVVPTEKYARVACEKGISAAEKLDDKYKIGMTGSEGFNYCMDWEDVKISIGKYEAAGYKEGQEKLRTVRIYTPKPWFEKYLANDKCLRNSGIKIYDIVKEILDPNIGPMFISSRFYLTTTIYIMAALKARGAEEYDPLVPPKNDGIIRATIITESNKKYHQDILSITKKKENVNGELLKAVIITPIGSTGLNIGGMEREKILEPPFTPAQLEQSKKRIFRPDSHIESFKKYKKKHKGAEYFPVFVDHYIAEPDQDEFDRILKTTKGNTNIRFDEYSDENHNINDLTVPDIVIPDNSVKRGTKSEKNFVIIKGNRVDYDLLLTPVDWKFYQAIKEKSDMIDNVMLMLKRVAVDAQINLERNNREIKCWIDNGDVYVMKTISYTPYNCNVDVEEDRTTYDSYYIKEQSSKLRDDITAIVTGSISIPSEQLFENLEDLGYTHLEVLMGLRDLTISQKSLYRDNFGFDYVLQEAKGIFYVTREETFKPNETSGIYSENTNFTIPLSLNYVIPEYIDPNKLEKKKILISDDPTSILFLSNIYKSALLERALDLDTLRSVSNEMDPEVFQAIISEMGLNVESEEEQWETEIKDALKLLYIETSDGVLIHQVNTLYDAGTNYNPVNSVLKAKTGLRIRRTPSSHWEFCTNIESLYYCDNLNRRFEKMLQKSYKKFQSLGFVGIIIRPKSLHIRTFTGDNKPYKVSSTGKDASNMKDHMLLPYLFEVHMFGKEKSIKMRSSERRGKLIDKIIGRLGDKCKLKPTHFKNTPYEELLYYYEVLSRKNRDLLYYLVSGMRDIGCILCVIGKLDSVIEDIRTTTHTATSNTDSEDESD